MLQCRESHLDHLRDVDTRLSANNRDLINANDNIPHTLLYFTGFARELNVSVDNIDCDQESSKPQ